MIEGAANENGQIHNSQFNRSHFPSIRFNLPLCTEFTGFLIQADYLNFVVVLFDETAQCQTKSFIRSNAPVHRIQWPWCQIFVDFFSLARRRRHRVAIQFRKCPEKVRRMPISVCKKEYVNLFFCVD